MSNDIDGFLGGAQALKFPDIGAQHTITVTEMPVKAQQTDFDSGEPLFWEDGKPREQLIVTGQLDREDWDDDEEEDDPEAGMRRLFVKSGLVKAFREALRTAKIKPSQMVGGRLTMTYVEDGPKPKRGFAPKIYEAEFTRGVSKAATADVDSFADGPDTESDDSRSVQHSGNGNGAARKPASTRAKASTGARGKAAAPAEDDEPPF